MSDYRPVNKEIVEELSRIVGKEHVIFDDPEKLETGVITNDFNNDVQKEGLFFAGYPMSLACRSGENLEGSPPCRGSL